MSVGLVIERGKHGGFQVVDGLGRQHFAPDAQALGQLVAELVDDTSIPQPVLDPIENPAVSMVAGVARRFLPGPYADLIDAARPVVSAAPPVLRAMRQVLEQPASPRRRRSKARMRSVREDR